MLKVAVTGALGRMGRIIAELALKDEDLKLVGVTEREDSGVIGTEFKEGVKFYASILEMEEKPDVVIDFTTPTATLKLLKEAESVKTALVVGTTGLGKDEMEVLKETSKKLPIVYSPNMSVGVNVLFKVVEEVSRILLGKGYDVEIFEIHHRFKKDAPSGTALKLAEIVSRAMGKKLEDTAVFGRRGITGPRKEDEIGVLSARMGDVPGEHRVFFAVPGEIIEFAHRATSRETFARGAIVSAKWIAGREPGLYTVRDVLEF